VGKKIFKILVILLIIYGAYWFGKRATSPQPLSTRTPGVTQFLDEKPSLVEKAPSETGEGGVAVEESTEEGSISERLVIKRGNLSLLVKETARAVEEAMKVAGDLGGFILSSRTWYTDEKKEQMQGEVVLKVPADKFSEALEKLKGLAIKVVSEYTTGQDVTEEYVDLESQLKNLEATEEQLREIMKRSGTISEILQVQRELTRIRGQIESNQGRMKYLRESAAMATITVYIATEEEELPIVEEQWRPMKVVKAALRSLLVFWQRIADTVIWFVVFFSPFILLVSLIWLIRKIRK
jgi:hypothetical protein